MASKTDKYIYLLVIQGNYGMGYEDLSEYADQPPNGPDIEDYGGGRAAARHDLKEYRLAESSYGQRYSCSHRIIKRRELRKTETE